MALHGPVLITCTDGGNKTIGYWSARRLEPLRNPFDPDREKHRYECVYEWPIPLFGFNDRVEFELEHTYGDGAETLAMAVMSEAASRRLLAKHPIDGGVSE